MDTLSFLELSETVQSVDTGSGFAERIQKIWEDRNQFEEAVQALLTEHEINKPRDIFY